VWFPVQSGVLHRIAEVLPSYWLVQASHVSIGGNGWGTRGWVVMAAWTVALILVAGWSYQRDTKRV
jgi:ABC-2 type transport system permease protein